MAFLLTAFGLVYGLHFYLWRRLVHDPLLPAPLYWGLTALTLLLALSLPLTLYVARQAPDGAPSLLVWPGWLWLGLFFVLLVAVVGADLLRLIVQAASPPWDPERRRTLWRLLAGGASVVAGGIGVASVREALGKIRVKKVVVELSNLPESLHGTTLVQLSDVHVGSTLGKRFVEQIVKTTSALNPDLVVITGDLVDGSVERLGEAVAPLAGLRSRFGTYFVTGNHDFYSGADAWCSFLEGLGVQVLRNQRVSIGQGADRFDLAGVEDFSAPRFGSQVDLESALRGRDPQRECVLLAHQPRVLEQAARAGVSLVLSGHTHGGQIWPFNFLVRLQQPVVAGLERFGRTWIYVSRGTGYWGPPMRWQAPAEVTQIVLHRARGELA